MKTPAILSRTGILLAAVLASFTACASASAASLSLPVAADSYIRSDNSNTNFGSAAELWVGQVNASVVMRSLLSFDLSTIPQNVTITSVSLKLYQSSEDGGSDQFSMIDIDLHLVPAFTESTVTWNNVGPYDTQVLTTAGVALRHLTTPKEVIWDSTAEFVAAIQQIYEGGGDSVSFLLKHDNEADIRRQLAKFAASGEYGATLNIEYTQIPESSTVALLIGTGAIGLTLLKRRSRG